MISHERITRLFPSFENALIENITENGFIHYFQEGDMLMKTGQNIRATVLVLEGRIKIFREDEEGNEFFMYYLNPGQACALSMICATRQQTSQIMAKTAAPSEILSIPIELMDNLMLTYKSWYYFVLETYRSRFEELLITVDHIAFRNMDERLLFYLKQQQQTLRSNTLSITNTEIATELNSSREVISRLMKNLSERGYIKIHRQHVELVDLTLSA
jgi:CRP/FNR family transcriptional regulator